MSSISPSKRMRSHSRTERSWCRRRTAASGGPNASRLASAPGSAPRPAERDTERIGQSANLGHCDGWSMRCEPTYVGAHVVPHL